MRIPLKNHFTDIVSYKKYIGKNNKNEKTYEEPITKQCRKHRFTTVMSLEINEKVVYDWVYYIDFEPTKYDLFDNMQVKEIREEKSLLTNDVQYYKIFV